MFYVLLSLFLPSHLDPKVKMLWLPLCTFLDPSPGPSLSPNGSGDDKEYAPP